MKMDKIGGNGGKGKTKGEKENGGIEMCEMEIERNR